MSDSVAIITGAGRGIGRAVAHELDERGFQLALVARTESDLQETDSSENSLRLATDITKPPAPEFIVRRATERFGRIDALVNCAGLAPVLNVEQTTFDEWQRTIDTNLSAAFHLCRSAWPIFRKQGAGVIVNVSSFAARDPFAGFAAYGAAKAGLNLLGLALAREGAPLGIRVHTVAPAAVETDMFRQILSPEQFSTDKTLLPADVARVIVQCIMGDLRHTSGEVIWLSKAAT